MMLLISKASEVFDKVCVRLHPKQILNQNLEKQITKYKISKSRGDLQKEVYRAEAVIGTNSSVLYEVSKLGKPVFQITEHARLDYEGVKKISLSEINKLPRMIQTYKCTVPSNNDHEDSLQKP